MKLETCLYLIHGVERRMGAYHSFLTYRIYRDKSASNPNQDDYLLVLELPEETPWTRMEEVMAILKGIKKDIRAEINWSKREILINMWGSEDQKEIIDKVSEGLGKLEMTGEVEQYGKDT